MRCSKKESLQHEKQHESLIRPSDDAVQQQKENRSISGYSALSACKDRGNIGTQKELRCRICFEQGNLMGECSSRKDRRVPLFSLCVTPSRFIYNESRLLGMHNTTMRFKQKCHNPASTGCQKIAGELVEPYGRIARSHTCHFSFLSDRNFCLFQQCDPFFHFWTEFYVFVVRGHSPQHIYEQRTDIPPQSQKSIFYLLCIIIPGFCVDIADPTRTTAQAVHTWMRKRWRRIMAVWTLGLRKLRTNEQTSVVLMYRHRVDGDMIGCRPKYPCRSGPHPFRLTPVEDLDL